MGDAGSTCVLAVAVNLTGQIEISVTQTSCLTLFKLKSSTVLYNSRRAGTFQNVLMFNDAQKQK